MSKNTNIYNKCCYVNCNTFIKRRKVVNPIVLNYCREHRKGYSRFICSGCNNFCIYNSGRPTHSFCAICVNKYETYINKYKCKYCQTKLNNDKDQICNECYTNTMRECINCKKSFDSNNGEFKKCYRCHFLSGSVNCGLVNADG